MLEKADIGWVPQGRGKYVALEDDGSGKAIEQLSSRLQEVLRQLEQQQKAAMAVPKL